MLHDYINVRGINVLESFPISAKQRCTHPIKNKEIKGRIFILTRCVVWVPKLPKRISRSINLLINSHEVQNSITHVKLHSDMLIIR
jgi:hypothetical protein